MVIALVCNEVLRFTVISKMELWANIATSPLPLSVVTVSSQNLKPSQTKQVGLMKMNLL